MPLKQFFSQQMKVGYTNIFVPNHPNDDRMNNKTIKVIAFPKTIVFLIPLL